MPRIDMLCNTCNLILLGVDRNGHKDLKLIYQDVDYETAEDELDNFEPNWGEQDLR